MSERGASAEGALNHNRAILIAWDPIGVVDLSPEEYENATYPLYRLLLEPTGRQEVEAHLLAILAYMGLEDRWEMLSKSTRIAVDSLENLRTKPNDH